MHLVKQVHIFNCLVAELASDTRNVRNEHAEGREENKSRKEYVLDGKLPANGPLIFQLVHERYIDILNQEQSDQAKNDTLTGVAGGGNVDEHRCYEQNQLVEVAVVKRNKALNKEAEKLVVENCVCELSPLPNNEV